MTDYTSNASSITISDDSRIAPGVAIGSYSTLLAIEIFAPALSVRLDGFAYASGTGIRYSDSDSSFSLVVGGTGGVSSDSIGALLNTGTVQNFGSIVGSSIGMRIQDSGTVLNYGVIGGG